MSSSFWRPMVCMDGVTSPSPASPNRMLGTGGNTKLYYHPSVVIHKLYKSKLLQIPTSQMLSLMAQCELPYRVLMQKQMCAQNIFPSLELRCFFFNW